MTKQKEEMPRKQYKRSVRNIIVHKPMQREFTLVLVALLMVSSLAIGFVIHDTIREAAFGGGFRFGKISPYEVLSEVRYQLIMKVTCILFVTLVVTGIFATFFLHRVAGPVYRFRQVFLTLNQGDVPHKIKLREGDFFSETAQEINRLIDQKKVSNDTIAGLKEKLQKIVSSDSSQQMTKNAKDALQLLEGQS